MELKMAMKRWIERLKQPPPWRAIRAMQAVVAVVCTMLAILAENRWIAVLDAFLAGTGAAGVLHATSMIKLNESVDGMRHAFNAMLKLNGELIQDKVQFILREKSDSDDAPPTAPRLH